MAIKITRRAVNTDQEKLIITGLITSDKFIKAIEPSLNKNLTLLQTSYGRIVAKWCLDFYSKYKKAPKKDIQEIFETKKVEQDEEVIQIISELLSGLSDSYEREKNYNEDYAIDQGLLYLRTQKINQLVEKINEAKRSGKIDEAENLLQEYKKIEKTVHRSIDVFQDTDKIIELINQEKDGIFKFPGAMGELLGPMDRGDFVAVAGPAKRGKTFWLIEFALRAVLSGLRVVFFSLEMSEKRMLIRIYQNLLGELKYLNAKEKVIERIPFFKESKDKENRFNIEYREVEKRGMTDKGIIKKARAMNVLARQGRFKLICVPNSSLSVEGVYDCIMSEVTKDNMVPDVVVVDYADIINPSFKTERRHQIDHTWKYLRRMADEMHCLFVTATHTHKKTLDKDIKPNDLAEDGRKLNHVSFMWALNQDERDREMMVMRVSVLGARFEDYRVDNQVVVTQNLAIGKPYLDSRWKKEVIHYRKRN